MLFSCLASRGPMFKNFWGDIYVYSKAHLKVYSESKINCSPLWAVRGDEMNRPHERWDRDWTILCIDSIGLSVLVKVCYTFFPFCFLLSYFPSISLQFFCSPALATHHLFHHTFSPFKEWEKERGRELQGGAVKDTYTQVCWLINRLLFVQIETDRHTHTHTHSHSHMVTYWQRPLLDLAPHDSAPSIFLFFSPSQCN